jgi:hypothetical protein
VWAALECLASYGKREKIQTETLPCLGYRSITSTAVHTGPSAEPVQGDVLVVRWVDRLGRNYDDVCATIRAFMERGVIIRMVINGLTFDGATTDPIAKAVRDALIGSMAATAGH